MQPLKPNEKFAAALLIVFAVPALVSAFVGVKPYSGRVKAAVVKAPVAKLRISPSDAPVSRTVVAGAGELTFASFQIDTYNSGEDVQIAFLKITHKTSAKNIQDSITNLTLYIDGSPVDPVIQPQPQEKTSAVYIFRFSTPVLIRKGDFKIFALKGTVGAGAAAGTHTFSCANADCLGAAGTASGKAVKPSLLNLRPAAITVANTGSVKLSRDSGNPRGQALEKKAEKIPVLSMRLIATGEPLDLKAIHFQTSPINRGTLRGEFANIYLFIDDAEIAKTAPTSSNAITFADIPAGAARIPVDAFGRKLTVKVDVRSGSAAGQGMSFSVGEDAYSFEGAISGKQVSQKNKSGAAGGNKFTLK